MITRNNYEEFFLLYVDNELSAADRELVERFVAENPDMKEEWELLLQCRIIPDHHLAFPGRASLLKQEGGLTGDGPAPGAFRSEKREPIDTDNYEEAFLSYIDGELDEDSRKSVEDFVSRHPSRLAELEYLQRTVSVPDPTIVFENKEVLYKKERDRRVVLLPRRIAAAALVASVIGLLIFNPLRKGPPERSTSSVIRNKMEQDKPSAAANVKETPDNQEPPANNEALVQKNNPGKSAGSVIKDIPDNGESAVVRGGQVDKGSPALKKNQLAVTPGPSAALHLSEAGQANRAAGSGKGEKRNNSHAGPDKGTEDDHGNGTLALTDPSVNKRVIDPTPVRIVANGNDGSAGKALVITALAARGPDIRNKENSSFATQALLDSSTGSPEDGFAMESSSSKKNKLRGLFRKVTRVLEKNTSRDEDDKHSVLIGGFQFALK